MPDETPETPQVFKRTKRDPSKPRGRPPGSGRKPAHEALNSLEFKHLEIARLYVKGVRVIDIAAKVGWSQGGVRNFLASEIGVAMCNELADLDGTNIRQWLKIGELYGIKTLIELCVTARSEKVRFDAGVRLAEMAGQPGKPTDRSESKQLTLSGHVDAREAIARALDDPGVAELIGDDTAIRGLLESVPQPDRPGTDAAGEPGQERSEPVPAVREQAG